MGRLIQNPFEKKKAVCHRKLLSYVNGGDCDVNDTAPASFFKHCSHRTVPTEASVIRIGRIAYLWS